MKLIGLRTSMALGLLAVACVMARADAFDATIKIDRALNSPTLTVSYSGANAKVVELVVNGESVASRSVSPAKASGEIDFRIDTSILRDGDNDVEIRLYDAAGHVVGTQSTTITTDSGIPAPFFMESPKSGATVEGPVKLTVGFSQSFAGSFVSFFIDNQLKSMSNTPPYTYLWDTSAEKNGWHEVESWLVDDASTTYKTKRIRVFVNNPQGQTPREHQPDAKPAAKPASPKQNPAGPAKIVGSPVVPNLGPDRVGGVAATKVVSTGAAESAALDGRANPSARKLAGGPVALKPVPTVRPISTGVRHLVPTGERLAVLRTPATKVHAAEGPLGAVRLMTIGRGSRIPNVPTFAVLMNGEFVNFDVQPRVDEGVPMTPLRFLLERDGGKVAWTNLTKTVTASADGRDLRLHIGDKFAYVGHSQIDLDRASYLSGGRTIVPLSFIRDALSVDVQYDKATGHVLITSIKK